MRKRYAHLSWRRRDPRHYRFLLPNAVWEYKLKPLEFVIFPISAIVDVMGRQLVLPRKWLRMASTCQ